MMTPPLCGMYSVLVQRTRQRSRERIRTIGRKISKAHCGSIGGYGRDPFGPLGRSRVVVLSFKPGFQKISLMREYRRSVTIHPAMIPAAQPGRPYHHSNVHTSRNQSHGTQSPQTSSNLRDCATGNPEKSNSAQSRQARSCEEIENAVFVSFRGCAVIQLRL